MRLKISLSLIMKSAEETSSTRPENISPMAMTRPAKERSFPISIVARPVTQTAELGVKRPSMKDKGPWAVEKGSRKIKVPKRIQAAKPGMKIRSGDRWPETKDCSSKDFSSGFK